MLKFARAIACAAALCAATSVHADGLLSTTFEAAAAAQLSAAPAVKEAAPERFAAGSWDMGVYGGAFTTINGHERTIYFGAVAPEFFFMDKVSVVGEMTAYGIDQADGKDGKGGGLTLLARWHFWECTQCHVAFYIEGGAGASDWDVRVPDPRGTHFNFTPQGGVGLKWTVCQGAEVILGGRYLHISNAGMQGGDRNPGIDSVGGYGGLVIHF